MIGIKIPWAGIARVVALLMVIGSVYVAYLWYYKYAPLRHGYDANWLRRHSAAVQWDEVQANIQRGGWSHDEFAC